MRKYAQPVSGSTPNDYRVIDSKRGIYEYRLNQDIKISRHSYENLKAQSFGWNSRYERDTARHTSEYKRWLTGTMQSGQKAAVNREQFEKLYIAAKRDNDFGNKSANGTLAQLLIFVGLRDEQATYPVGQTPSKKPR